MNNVSLRAGVAQTEEVVRALLLTKGLLVVSSAAAIVFIGRRLALSLNSMLASLPLAVQLSNLLQRRDQLSQEQDSLEEGDDEASAGAQSSASVSYDNAQFELAWLAPLYRGFLPLPCVNSALAMAIV